MTEIKTFAIVCFSHLKAILGGAYPFDTNFSVEIALPIFRGPNHVFVSFITSLVQNYEAITHFFRGNNRAIATKIVVRILAVTITNTKTTICYVNVLFAGTFVT